MNEVMKNVDIVYHCAATAHEGLSVFYPYEITKNNYLASVSVFTASVSHKVKRIIFCSSMARYGYQQTPFTEDMEPKPIYPYAISTRPERQSETANHIIPKHISYLHYYKRQPPETASQYSAPHFQHRMAQQSAISFTFPTSLLHTFQEWNKPIIFNTL